MPDDLWQVDLSADAAADIERIVQWSARRFGELQAIKYSAIIERAVTALAAGPNVLGSLPAKLPSQITYRKIHLSLNRKGASHLLFYRQTGPRLISVVRVLHERMDPKRHLPTAGEG